MKPVSLKNKFLNGNNFIGFISSCNKSISFFVKYLYLSTIIIGLVLTFGSCRSTKNMKIFKDALKEIQPVASQRAPEYLIRADDNLYVDVQSMNQEVNQLFSPSKSINNSGGTQSDYGQASSQYLNGYRVDQKGSILLPVIGEVKVSGMSEETAKISVQKRVDEYFKGATVKVKILTYKVTVLGEVKNPGVYYNYDKSITILEALGLANGTTDYASIKKVLVLRNTPSGSMSYRLDLRVSSTMTSEAFYLLPNDVLYVEPDKYKNNYINTSVFSITLAAFTTAVLILSYINK